MNTQTIIDGQVDRSKALMAECLKHLDDSVATVWGQMIHVDGYFLAALELGQIELAKKLFDETLDAMMVSILEEAEHPNLKFHLADFAIQPLFLAYSKYKDADLDWDRFKKVALQLKPHYGDLSENHNFLHLTIRHVMARLWPDDTLLDGKNIGSYAVEELPELLKWMNEFITLGTSEWGSDIYMNVDLMALLNLIELSDDPVVKQTAEVTLNTIMLDQALDAKFGAPVGAAKRIYSVYRMDTRESPSLPLHHVWFGTAGEVIWNPNFIGAAIMAAAMDYHPDPRIIELASEGTPHETYAWHRAGLFTWGPFGRLETDPPLDPHLGRYTKRGQNYVLGSMIASPCRARYTEQAFQITLGERAIVFGNHPASFSPGDTDMTVDRDNPDLFERYLEARLPDTNTERRDQPSYWVYANMPPGSMNHSDKRPGWWQGNQDGPRSFGRDDWTVQLWKINDCANVDFTHVYFPQAEFDEIIWQERWVAFRKGYGAGVLYFNKSYEKTDKGVWKDQELCVKGPETGIYAAAGDLDVGQSLADFLESHQKRGVSFGEHTFKVCVGKDQGADSYVEVDWLTAPRLVSPRGSIDLSCAGARLETPFGQINHAEPMETIGQFFNTAD